MEEPCRRGQEWYRGVTEGKEREYSSSFVSSPIYIFLLRIFALLLGERPKSLRWPSKTALGLSPNCPSGSHHVPSNVLCFLLPQCLCTDYSSSPGCSEDCPHAHSILFA